MLGEKQLRGIIRMLKNIQTRIWEMLDERGEEARLGIGVRQYNAILDHLIENDVIPDGLFITLEDDAPGEDVDLCCAQLAGYLEGFWEAPEGKEVIDKNGIGELIREAMPSWIKERVVIPSSGKKETILVTSSEKKENLSDLEGKMAQLSVQMQDLAQQMREDDATGENKMKELAEQMRHLAQQQAELAKQFASPSSQKEE